MGFFFNDTPYYLISLYVLFFLPDLKRLIDSQPLQRYDRSRIIPVYRGLIMW